LLPALSENRLACEKIAQIEAQSIFVTIDTIDTIDTRFFPCYKVFSSIKHICTDYNSIGKFDQIGLERCNRPNLIPSHSCQKTDA
jgi:hypothetical protein